MAGKTYANFSVFLFPTFLTLGKTSVANENKTLEQSERWQLIRDLLAFVGFVLLIAGISFYDWRAGCIVAGAFLLVAGVVGSVLTAKGTSRQRK
jgi:hypothetical protein